MQPMIGSKLKEKHATKWLSALAGRLFPGEAVSAVAKTSSARPLLDGVAVTNARVMAFYSGDIESKGFRLEVRADDLAQVEVVKRFGTSSLAITSRRSGTTSFGAVPEPDMELIVGAVRQLAATGPAPAVHQAMAHQAGLDRQAQEAWSRVPVVGGAPNEATWKALKDHSSPGETAWFVVSGVSAGGVFAAFGDRCMIVKIGAMTSFMAGSLGGGRVTTFPYSEITAIEYNAGMVTGVLEVLTASYSGRANKDYWRGSNKSRNADANDPWTQSNTLPLGRLEYQQALPKLNEIRTRIAEIKRPTIVMNPPPQPAPPATPSLTDELTKLGALREQGILTDAEFGAAKQRLLAQHGLG